MANKKQTFKEGVKESDLAIKLRDEYAKNVPPPFVATNFIGTQKHDKNDIWLLERNRYSSNGDKSNKGNENFIPRIEISNRMYEKSPILFVGMNPSGADCDHYKDYCEYHEESEIPNVFIYCGDSPYYETMKKFASECLEETVEEGNVSHKYSELDLFGIVQSTQAVIQEHFLQYPQHYVAMFDLFLKYVKIINPKVIIVANAFVHKVLQMAKEHGQKFNSFYEDSGKARFNLINNTHFGGYRFSIDIFETQLYFSSMLSGQRALDLGSRENLVWLVRNYLKNNPK